MVPSFISDFARHGDAPALVFPNNRVITYAELARRVDQQAQRFGTGKRLVAVEARPSEHAIIAYLAALKRGHAVALLPPDDAGTAERFEVDFRPDYRYRMLAAGGARKRPIACRPATSIPTSRCCSRPPAARGSAAGCGCRRPIST